MNYVRSGFLSSRVSAPLVGLGLALTASATTITVNTVEDTLSGMDTSSVAALNASGTRSLRGAIIAVNNDAGSGHTIVVPAGTYTLGIAGTGENAAATGDLDILKAVTIQGAGSAMTLVQAGGSSANGIDRILSVNPLAGRAGFAVSISGFTFRNGRNPVTAIVPGDNAGGAMDFDAGAGGTGSLTLSDVAFSQNATTNGDGGALALFNGGTVTMGNCTFTGNSATSTSAFGANGGALFVGVSPNALSLTCTSCLFDSNSTAIGSGGVAGRGGAAFSYQPTSFTITNSRIVGNVAAVGAPALEASTVTAATINAANNWFGANSPSESLFSGAVTVSPNLVLSIAATPTEVTLGQTTATVVAGITTNSVGGTGFSVPDSTPVAFAATLGSITPVSSTLAAGTRNATFTPTAVGAGSASAMVDGETVSVGINVLGALSPFQTWQLAEFTDDADNDAIAGASADPDGDGLTNLIEYALGLDPDAPSANSVVVDTETGALRLTAARNPAATDVTYLVEVSSDLETWTSAGTTVAVNTASLLQVLDNTPINGATRRFIRLKITMP